MNSKPFKIFKNIPICLISKLKLQGFLGHIRQHQRTDETNATNHSEPQFNFRWKKNKRFQINRNKTEKRAEENSNFDTELEMSS